MDGRALAELARVTCRGDFIARVARGFLVVEGATPPTVLPVHHAFGNASPPDRVSVGRAPTRDVTLADASVSSLHAHFDLTRQAVQLVDHKSHRGTRLNGRALQAHAPAIVVSGDVIEFGRVTCRFFDAADLYDRLR